MLNERISAINKRFLAFDDWEDRYRELIVIGKSLAPMDEKFQLEKYRIKGCQSQVWLKPIFKDGKVSFLADSDAILVKGIIGILLAVYSEAKPSSILSSPPTFLKEIGITEHLSMNRTNGLSSMVKQIQMYAAAFNSLLDKGVTDADI